MSSNPLDELCPHCRARLRGAWEATITEARREANAQRTIREFGAVVDERDALRADLERLERQVHGMVTKEVYNFQVETVTRLREDLRACAEALQAIYDDEKSKPHSVRSAGLLEAAYAALGRLGVMEIRK